MELSSSKNALCKVWLKLGKCFCRMRFLNVDNVHYLATILPWKNLWSFISTKLNYLHPSAKFCCSGLVVLENISFLKVGNTFPICSDYLPLENGVVLRTMHLYILNDALCQVWLIKKKSKIDKLTDRLMDRQQIIILQKITL